MKKQNIKESESYVNDYSKIEQWSLHCSLVIPPQLPWLRIAPNPLISPQHLCLTPCFIFKRKRWTGWQGWSYRSPGTSGDTRNTRNTRNSRLFKFKLGDLSYHGHPQLSIFLNFLYSVLVWNNSLFIGLWMVTQLSASNCYVSQAWGREGRTGLSLPWNPKLLCPLKSFLNRFSVQGIWEPLTDRKDSINCLVIAVLDLSLFGLWIVAQLMVIAVAGREGREGRRGLVGPQGLPGPKGINRNK